MNSNPTPRDERGPGRPPKEAVAAHGHVHIRTTMERKIRWVKAAQRNGIGLSEWITRAADSAAELAELGRKP
jgi:hypothetical protein